MDNKKSTLLILLGAFITTELIDDFFDHILGNSILHSAIQLVLFLGLFFMATKIFLNYHKKQITKLIPEELLKILTEIKKSEQKGILTNQVKIQKQLNITKPTAKKRIDNLLELKYITFQTKGNNKYLTLTEIGHSILK